MRPVDLDVRPPVKKTNVSKRKEINQSQDSNDSSNSNGFSGNSNGFYVRHKKPKPLRINSFPSVLNQFDQIETRDNTERIRGPSSIFHLGK